jgi:hypothetical protein
VTDISDITEEALEGQSTRAYLLAERAKSLETLYRVNEWEYKCKKRERIGESLNDSVSFGDQEAGSIRIVGL